MGVRAHAQAPPPRARPRGPGLAAALVVALPVFLLLAANGRTLPTPPLAWAASLALSAASALASLAFELDATGAALVGKLLAALCAAVAAAALFAAVARRHGLAEGRWAGFSLALGTTLAAAAQAWSGEAAATAAVAMALLLLVKAEEELRAFPAALAGLPLGLAAALQPSALPLALVLVLAVALRWRLAGLAVLAWALPGTLAALAGFATSPTPGASAPAAGAPADVLVLLASPAKGLAVFAPVALAGLAGLLRALRGTKHRLWDQAAPSRMLPFACLAGAVVHVGWLAASGGWSEGPFWGPRLVAPVFPLLLLFLPEGFALLRVGATLLVLASIAVQSIGLVSYDGRWDKLHAARARSNASAWDLRDSPIAFAAHERVARIALPALEGRRLTTRERSFAPKGDAGSYVTFAKIPPAPTGADQTFDALRFDGGARFEAGALVLAAEGDGLGFHVRDGARPRRLEVRIAGHGSGRLGLGESGAGQGTRWRDSTVSGAFRLRLPYFYAESGGSELRLALRAGGPIRVDSLALVPPSEPENVLRLP